MGFKFAGIVTSQEEAVEIEEIAKVYFTEKLIHRIAFLVHLFPDDNE